MRREIFLISRGRRGAMAGAGPWLGLKSCRTNRRNVGFPVDHVCFIPNGRPRRTIVDTAVFAPFQTFGPRKLAGRRAGDIKHMLCEALTVAFTAIRRRLGNKQGLALTFADFRMRIGC